MIWSDVCFYEEKKLDKIVLICIRKIKMRKYETTINGQKNIVVVRSYYDYSQSRVVKRKMCPVVAGTPVGIGT